MSADGSEGRDWAEGGAWNKEMKKDERKWKEMDRILSMRSMQAALYIYTSFRD